MEYKNYSEIQVQDFVYNMLMDSIYANLYITDVDTYEVLYMNRIMKEMFQVEHPEGRPCWQVLQKGMDGPCPFCPVPKLLKQQKENERPIVKWMEENTLLKRSYDNYDTLIEWVDGRTVHLQHSVDVTEQLELTKEARIDELTQMFNRRAGKLLLAQRISEARRAGVPLSVCLYDLDGLKYINDNYGHIEGDRALSFLAETVLQNLRMEDFAFRMGGDEFVIVFWNMGSGQALQAMEDITRQIEQTQGGDYFEYVISFCYGIAEAVPSEENTVSELIARADHAMYEEKRERHIRKAEQKLLGAQSTGRLGREFPYDGKQLYRALSESTDDYIYIGNMKTGTFRYPAAMVKEFEIPGEIVENAAAVWGPLIHPHDKKDFMSANQEVADGRAECHNVEYRAKNRKGQWVWLRCRGRLVRDKHGNPDMFAGIITNLGIKNRIDHLTGLYNKIQLEEEVHRQIRNFPSVSFGLLILGMDDFKHINDLYNREFGDEVLRITSQKIRSILPGNAELYRMDGDEFCLLFRGSRPEKIRSLYQRIQEVFRNQQQYNGNKYYCTVSGGVSFYPQNGKDYQTLIKYAAYALEFTKHNGKNRVTIFDEQILRHRKRELDLNELLRESMEASFRDYCLYYQPQVDSFTGELKGAEALARWRNEKYGEVSPAEFIPILEQSGMILQVGRWITEEAVRQCSIWRKHKPDFVMSINLSYLQVIEPDFIQHICQVAGKYGVPCQNLMFELTETYFVKEREYLKGIFECAREMGFGIAMDDFGTGYSSLGVLKDILVSLVKIDKTFVRNISQDSFDATFIQFIVRLCHNVGKRVCLEGVETEEEYQIVKKSGPEYIQGYYFGRPVPVKEFEEKYLELRKA